MQNILYYNTYMDIITDSIKSWLNEQNNMKAHIITRDAIKYDDIKYVGAVDISFDNNNPNIAIVYIIVLKFDDLAIVYSDQKRIEITVPYVSGFFGFFEVPNYVKLINKLRRKTNNELVPDVILVGGNGNMCYKQCGSASQLGIITGIPTIGCGKTFLCVDGINDQHIRQKLKILSGSSNYNKINEINLMNDYGNVLQFGTNDPIYVFIGHKLSLNTATKIVKYINMNKIREQSKKIIIIRKTPKIQQLQSENIVH